MHPQKHKPPGSTSTKGLVAALLALLVSTFLMSLNAPVSASPQIPLQAVQQTSDDETGTPNAPAFDEIDVTFIIINPPTPTRTPTPVNIGNFVWDDLDKDGRQDAGEPGLSGVKVKLWDPNGVTLLDSATTNASGIYALTAPKPGNFRIQVILPGGSDQFSPKDQAGGDNQLDSDVNPTGTNAGYTDAFNIASNVISTTIWDFGIIKYRTPTPTRTPTPINLGNFIWNDLNSNGVQDGGEPGLANVTVQLWDSTKTYHYDSDSTNSSGIYALVAPVPGSYRIKVLLPPGSLFAPKDQGSDLSDSDVNADGFTDTIVLASNVISITSIDAGLSSVDATPTPDAASGDTLALFGAAATKFSLVDTLQANPSASNYLTILSNAPIKGKFVMGDWDGNGQMTPGLFQNGKFWYTNQTNPAATWKRVNIGNFGAVNAVAGRFDAAFPNDCFGVVQTQNVPQNHDFRLHYTCELGQPNPPNGIKKQWIDVTLPAPGAYQFVAGDWDGDGLDSIAVRRSNKIKWGNVAPAEGAAAFPKSQNFGKSTESYGTVVAGDWNNDGIDTFGLFNKGNGAFYRRNDLNSTKAALTVQNLGKPVGNAIAASWRKTNLFLSLGGLLPVPPAPENNVVPVVTSTPPPPTITPVPTYWPMVETPTPQP